MDKNKVSILAAALSLAAASAIADGGIAVSNVTLSQTANREIVVTYRLTGAGSAVVTMDILTNGVSIGEQNFTSLKGAVNTIVPTSDTATNRIFWTASKDWPNHKIDGMTVKVDAWAPTNPPNYLVMDLASGERTFAAPARPTGGPSRAMPWPQTC